MWQASTWRTSSCVRSSAGADWPERCWRQLARECIDGGYTRLSWAVLDWNVNAIALYDAVGGKPQDEWITYRVSGPELSALADES